MSGFKVDGIDIDTICDFDNGSSTQTLTQANYKISSNALTRKYYKHFHKNVASFPELQVSIGKYNNNTADIMPTSLLLSPKYDSFETAGSGNSISIPSGIAGMYVFIAGGGGGGGGGGLDGDHVAGRGGGGGGSGAILCRYIAAVAGKTTFNYTVGAGGGGGDNGYKINGYNINSSERGAIGGAGGQSSFTYNSVTYIAPGGSGGGGGSYNNNNTLGGAGGVLPTETGILVTNRDVKQVGDAGSANSSNDGGGGGSAYPGIQASDYNWLNHTYNTYRWMGQVTTNNRWNVYSFGTDINPGDGGGGGHGDRNSTSDYPLDGNNGGSGMVKIWWLYGPK